MTRQIAIAIVFLFFLFPLSTDAQTIIYEQSFGCDKYEGFDAVVQAHQSQDVIAVGRSQSDCGDVPGNLGGADIWICRINLMTGMVWKRNHGSVYSDHVNEVIANSRYGYTVVGTRWVGTDADIQVTEVDSNGNLLWQKTFGGSKIDNATQIIETSDKGFLIVGYTLSSDGDISSFKGVCDIWILKVDSLGNLVWEKTYGGTNSEMAEGIDETADGNYIVAGFTASSDGDVSQLTGITNVWLLKIDVQGNLLWEKTYGGTSGDGATGIKRTPDNGYIVVASSTSSDGDLTHNAGDYDCWVFKTDSLGNLLWQNSFGGSQTEDYFKVVCSKEGGFFVMGNTNSNDGDVVGHHFNKDVWVLKISDSGMLEWQRPIGGSDYENSGGLIQLPDSSYILAATSGIISGNISINHGHKDGWLVQIANQNINNIKSIPAAAYEFEIFPNPSSGYVNIRGNCPSHEPIQISLFNPLGQLLHERNANCETQLDLTRLQPGMYFIKLSTDSNSEFRSLILQ